jgi:Fur family transcriptional regulator, zinc uptake regulator
MSAPFGWSEGRRPLNLEAGPSPLMTSPCPHDRETAPPTAAQVERALGAAAARVAAAGDRLTRPRRRVLELLLIAGSPAKAYDLVATYHQDARVAKPATVYRALQFLETRGLVHRLSTLKSYVACDPERPGAPALYLLCDCCGSCREVPAPDLAALNAAATATGYEIERITLEGQGLCSACRPPRPGAARDSAVQTEPEAAAGSGPARTEPRP